MSASPIAQFPGAEDAIRAAASRGWEAVLLVVLVCVCFATFGVILRQIMKEANEREVRLSNRVTHLEDIIREELMKALAAGQEMNGRMLSACDAIVHAATQMTATLERFTSILDVRPCLLPAAEQRRLLKEFEDTEGK